MTVIDRDKLFELPGFKYGLIEVENTTVMYIQVFGNPTTDQYLTCNKHLWQLYDESPATRIDLLADLLQCTGLPPNFIPIFRGSATGHAKSHLMHIVVGHDFIRRMIDAMTRIFHRSAVLYKTLEEALAAIQKSST